MRDDMEWPVRPAEEYLAHLAEGRFMVQRCRDSGDLFFHPRVAAPATGSTNLEWVELSGRGTVYSTTVVRQKPPAQDYNVALIDLEEGPRMMARVDGVPPEDVAIGMAVRARIVTENDQPLVIFRPA
ncbi:Zn-ribbon domain-containing OB-fold protein [Sphingobium sp. YBL2]|uniref:Zn-ribbon domain-containing OB-fold protein n=1 Tax=Sphingobium sp. (strain YBL2) TaxID=484429 RepID=UPI001EE1E563|nr:Zn-ribbon domain-containing OB-fold protein [Sphingobium sp. YBL2]